MSLVARLPSLFKKVSVRRQNADIGGRTIIGLEIFPMYMEAVPFNEREIFIEVKMPKSAGKIEKTSCYSDLDTIVS